MNRKKILMIGAIAVVVVAVIAMVVGRSKSSNYIFDKKDNIKLRDMTELMKHVDFNDGNVKDYFHGKVANPYTIKFFKSLEADERFKNAKSMDELFEKVKEYLYSVMSPDEAEKLLTLFKKYMNYQQELIKETKNWGTPKKPDDMIDYLKKLQEYRRNYFGRETADILFGADIKFQEYPLRRIEIINEDTYAKDKLARIKKLNRDMWGEEADMVETYTKPYNRYQEMQEIYKKDMEGMSAEDKAQLITKMRTEIFTPEQVKRLEDVDKLLADEKNREDNYRAQEQKIMNDPSLNQEQKDAKLQQMQDDVFGDEADAFRRREAISKGIKDFRK